MRLPLAALALMLPLALPLQAQDAGHDVLVARAERLVDALLAGDYTAATADFDSTMRAVLPPDKLEVVASQLAAQVGSFRERGGTRVGEAGGYTAVFVTLVYERTPLDARVVFDADGQVTGLFFQPSPAAAPYAPPAYVDTTAFRERPVTVDAGAGLPLDARLTLPRGDGPFPGVVLVHGSGPSDLDETIGPNKVFRDLAWGLASQGIAVLRYEKRTRAYPGRFADAAFTVEEEVVADAVAALERLAAAPEVDAARTFVVGHSLGGLLAPRIAARAGVAGAVLLAAPARPLDAVMRDQLVYLDAVDSTAAGTAGRAALRAELDRLADLPDLPAGALVAGVPAAYWRDLLAYDPLGAVRALGAPVLVVHAGRDYQVTAPDLAAWRTLEDDAAVTITVLPGLNHLLMPGAGPSTPAEYERAGHVDPAVVEAVARWVRAR